MSLTPHAADDPEFLIRVGQITVRWSVVETSVHIICWRLFGLTMEAGQQLTSGRRWREVWGVVRRQIVEAGSLELTEHTRRCSAALEEAAKSRNRVVHSVWVHDIPSDALGQMNLTGRGAPLVPTVDLISSSALDESIARVEVANNALTELLLALVAADDSEGEP